MPIHDELGTRMKENYEMPPRTSLTRRTPVIIRVDGKAFHTLTHNFKKPFDGLMIKCMQETMQYLCENIQGCVLGYVQSDEISLLLTDYKRHTSSAWFDYEVMKVCSISASMATLAFNRSFSNYLSMMEMYINDTPQCPDSVVEKLHEIGVFVPDYNKMVTQYNHYKKAFNRGACFDSRCFNIPKEEVTNYFYWRQLDASRNSVEMAGYANFSTKELHKKSCSQIQDMLHELKGINWNDYSVPEKRGTCCIKKSYEIENPLGQVCVRSGWFLDTNIPIFKGNNREYIDSRFMNIEED